MSSPNYVESQCKVMFWEFCHTVKCVTTCCVQLGGVRLFSLQVRTLPSWEWYIAGLWLRNTRWNLWTKMKSVSSVTLCLYSSSSIIIIIIIIRYQAWDDLVHKSHIYIHYMFYVLCFEYIPVQINISLLSITMDRKKLNICTLSETQHSIQYTTS